MILLKHPKNVCLTYCEHLVLSLEFSIRFYIASIKAIIHAFLPFMFITSTSDTIKIIDKKLKVNKCKQI